MAPLALSAAAWCRASRCPPSWTRSPDSPSTAKALDGFLKVFWYDDPGESALEALLNLWPQLAFLAAITVTAFAHRESLLSLATRTRSKGSTSQRINSPVRPALKKDYGKRTR